MAHEELWNDDRIKALIEAGFAKVSRNPSDHETAAAYRYAIKMALTSKADKFASALEALTTAQAEADALRKEVEALRGALEPFSRYVDKASCQITMIWQDGDYRSTYTHTLKPDDFFAARAALSERHP